jgi:hypothetical protein
MIMVAKREVFQVGDVVEWTSQSSGYTRTKWGVVARAIDKAKNPTSAVLFLVQSFKAVSEYGYGSSRDHESYIVLTPGKTIYSGPGLYWPIVSKLRKLKEQSVTWALEAVRTQIRKQLGTIVKFNYTMIPLQRLYVRYYVKYGATTSYIRGFRTMDAVLDWINSLEEKNAVAERDGLRFRLNGDTTFIEIVTKMGDTPDPSTYSARIH